MKISHDKESGAVYIRLREGVSDHTEGLSEKADVYVDVDSNGIVLGLEALSFDDLAQVIDESGGELDVSLVNGVLGTPKLGAEMEAIEKALDELPKKEK